MATSGETDVKAALPSDADLELEERTTADGTKYRVGRPTGSQAAKQQAAAAAGDDDKVGSHGAPFGPRAVDWPAGNHGDTDDDYRLLTGISKWQVDKDGIAFKYRLWFYTVQTYDYAFQDQSGQWLTNDVWREGWHVIDYNSDRPNIISSRGS